MSRSTSAPLSVPRLPEARAWLAGARLPARVAVAWSGGADSTALLLALAGAGFTVHAWHVDHAWHPDSAALSRTLSERAAAWGIHFTAARLTEAPASNREAAARRARRARFLRWARRQGIDTLCLAHHRDDQAETVCLRMLQGAGVTGCRGMLVRRALDGLTLARPLLHVPRAELRAALERAGVGWYEDPANRDLSLYRNRIRHRLFPSFRAAGVDPAALFLRWGRAAAALAAAIERDAQGVELRREGEGVSVSWGAWRARSAPVRARVLQRMVAALRGEGTVLGRRHLELVERWLAGGGRGGLDLSRARLSRRGDRLRLAPPHRTL